MTASAATGRPAVLVADLAAAGPLLDALAARGVPADVQVAGDLRLDLAVRRVDATAVVNLVGEDATAAVRAFTAEYLAYLADIQVPTVNGLDAFVIGASRARQLALLDHLGVHHPPARVVADASGVDAAVAELGAGAAATVVWDGPPVVVQAAADAGEIVTLAYVAGRQVAALAGGETVAVDPALARLGEEIVRTGGLELGSLRFGVDALRGTPTCVGVSTGWPIAVLDEVADHVLGRITAG